MRMSEFFSIVAWIIALPTSALLLLGLSCLCVTWVTQKVARKIKNNLIFFGIGCFIFSAWFEVWQTGDKFRGLLLTAILVVVGVDAKRRIYIRN